MSEIADLVESVNELTQKVHDMVSVIDEKVDDQIFTEKRNYPAVNMLKNSRANQRDSDGDLISPLSLYAGSQATLMSQEVVLFNDVSLPDELNRITNNRGMLANNVIKVTLSKGDGNGSFILLPSRPVIGKVTAGARAIFANKNGVTISGKVIEANTLYEDVRTYKGETLHWNIDGLKGSVSSNDVILYIVAPWICAGRVEGHPTFFIDTRYKVNETL